MIEFLKEFRSYLLGVAIEGGKVKRGWKGYLFVWPFVLFLFVIIGLIINELLKLFS